MYITARLQQAVDSNIITDIEIGKVFSLAPNQEIYGMFLKVVAGPHADFSTSDVYTCELDTPHTLDRDYFPYFNSDGKGWGCVTLIVRQEHDVECLLV